MLSTSSPAPEAALPGTPPRNSPRFWRRAQRLARAAGLALLLLWAVLLAAWLALRWAILPHIDEWRPSVERVASRSLGLKVRLGAIRVQTAGWTPTFELHDLRVYDRDGLEALQVQRVQAALAPRALLAATLRFEQIVIDGARLQARRDVQGRWHFAAQAWEGDFDAADTRARDWLLRQGEFVVRDAELHWIDERAGTAPLTLRDLQFVLRNGLRSHALRLDATPPPHWGQRFSLRARFTQPLLARPGELQRWSGTLFAEFPQADAAALRRQLSLPFELDEGDGALRAWIDIVDGSVRKATADFALRAVTLRLTPTSEPLRLQQLLGRVALARDASGIELRLRQLAAAAPADRAAPPWSIGDVRLSWQQAQDLHQRWTSDTPVTGGEFSADALDLRSLGPLIDALPADAALRERLAGLAPSGHADKLRLRWSGAPQQPHSYRIDARLRDLTLRAGVSSAPGVPARPGVQAAQVDVSATERGGEAKLSMRSGALVFPGVWEQPELPLDQLDATLAWQIARRGGSSSGAATDPGAIDLRVSKLSFANADLRGEASAVWRSGARNGHDSGEPLPGRLELDARLLQVRADRVARYLPLGIASTAREHVRDAVRAGTVRSASFKVHGDLARFPFHGARDGEFRVVLQLHDVNYAFLGAPWPPVEHASGELEFNRLAMQLRRVQGRLHGYELRGVQGGIADLSADEPVLKLQAQGQGPAADVLRLAQLAPLGPGMGAMLEPVSVSGPSTLSLALRVPLAGPQPVTLQGALQLDGTELRVHPDVPPLLGARGSLLVESDTLALRALHARWLGGEASFDGSIKADGSMRVNANGTASAEGLRQWPALAEAAAPLRGQTAWRGTLSADGARMALLLQSNLAGMALDLPPPLAKAAAAALPLRLQLSPLADATPAGGRREQLQFELGEVLKLQLERERSEASGGAARVLRASVAVQDALPPLPAAGLQASLNLARVDLDAWRALAARAGGAGTASLLALPGPQQIRLRADELRIDGRALTRLQATLSQERQERGGDDTLWRSHVESDQLAGDIEYRVPSADPQAAVLKARLQRLSLPRAPAAAGDGVLGKAQPRLPGLDIVVDDFEWGARKLGRLQLAAANRALPGAAGLREWQLDRLELDSPDAQLRASARWAASGARRTALDFKLQLHDGGAFAERLGMANALRGGNGWIDGQLSWAGSPLAPEFTSLDGQLRLELGAGQFLQADPGGARLLGVLSLQALPRRLSLDFRDLFQEGFVFDSVDGDIRVVQGVAHTDNLRLRGMQATVLLNGRADLRRETQDLHVHVVPNFDAAGAALATMAINPVVGLGTLFAQWALREPLIAANTRELHITGSWAEPSVQRIERADRGNAAPTDRRPPG